MRVNKPKRRSIVGAGSAMRWRLKVSRSFLFKYFCCELVLEVMARMASQKMGLAAESSVAVE